MKIKHFNFLLSPWIVLGAAGLGIYFGIQFPGLASSLTPFGDIFISLIEMCVIPIMLASIISSIGYLLVSDESHYILKSMTLSILAAFVLASFAGLATGLLGEPGTKLDTAAKITLGKTISATELSADSSDAGQDSAGLLTFIQEMVPKNIIRSITEDNRLAIVFFSILLGLALGISQRNNKQNSHNNNSSALNLINALYESMLTILNWIMYILPFGLFALLASQIAQIGIDILLATLHLIVCIYVGAFMLIIIFSLIIWRKIDGNYLTLLARLRRPLLVALGTSNSFAAIPSAIHCLVNHYKLNRTSVKLMLPLGIAINPPGSIFHFSLATLFIAQIFGVELTASQYLLVFIGAILAGVASSAAPGIVAISMITIILEPLQLPTTIAIILLAAIDPIVDPILTVVNVQGNCAAASLVANKQNKALVSKHQPLAATAKA